MSRLIPTMLAIAGPVLLCVNETVAAADSSQYALDDRRGTFSFVWENDTAGGTDKNYTNGIRLAWLSGTKSEQEVPGFLSLFGLRGSENAVARHGFAIGHSIYTPNDIDTPEPLPDQHPYAAWLYAEYAFAVQKQDQVDRFGVTVGIVGPSAGGESLQNSVHSIIDSTRAAGWDNQIDDEAGLVLTYDRKLRALWSLGDSGLGADLTPSWGFALGNIHTNVRAGLTFRFGQDLRSDYGPPRVRPALAGTGFFSPRDGTSWYVFFGAEGRGVAHNIFLDGSLFRDGDPQVTREPWVVDYQGGIVVQRNRVQLGLTFVNRTDEFEEQTTPQRFGALSVAVKF